MKTTESYIKKCAMCKQNFISERDTKLYCSNKCRDANQYSKIKQFKESNLIPILKYKIKRTDKYTKGGIEYFKRSAYLEKLKDIVKKQGAY